jgi:thioredoxin 1
MKVNKIKYIGIALFCITSLMISACGQKSLKNEQTEIGGQSSVALNDTLRKYKVTFIELGSVKCLPCQMMQAVMKSIETKYGRDVKVDFHDVWTDAGKPWGVKYGIESIPTQIFLDETGKEYFRHVGYFAEAELVKVLQMKGVKLN